MKAEIQGKVNLVPRTFPWKMEKALETRLRENETEENENFQ